MSVIASLVLLYLVSPSSSLPPPLHARNPSNGTSTQPEPSWKSGPKGRGTYSLIISCLTTLSLCVWTAVHLNVRPKESDIRNIWRRMLWMFVAVFIPELVLYCAYDQWSAARKLKNEINKLAETAIAGDSPLPVRPRLPNESLRPSMQSEGRGEPGADHRQTDLERPSRCRLPLQPKAAERE